MKKNTLQKTMALSLAGVMAMGSLTGCGGQGQTGPGQDHLGVVC